ncbi:unnamed protein product [Calypogeia fissa]
MTMFCLQGGGNGGLFMLLTLVSLMMTFLLVAIAANTKSIFYEAFDTSFSGRWIPSKSIDYKGRWKYEKGKGNEDYGLLVSEPAKKYAIAVNLPKIVDFIDTPIVFQYDLRLQNRLSCGGAYLKFLAPQDAGWTLSKFDNGTPYSIMFGPDRCGETDKVHFIFRHKSPKTGEYVEHHLKSPPIPRSDTSSHVYTAVIYPNNTLQLLIDGEEIYEKLPDLVSHEDFEPSVVPPKTIPDPKDKMPKNWDDREKIPNLEAVKPEDWDENAPRMIDDEEAKKPGGWLDDESDEIDDPKAVKPKDWEDEEDGEWEAPKVHNPKCYGEKAIGCGVWVRPTKRNPAYKGKWSPPLLVNPDFMGIWKPRNIDNPDWFELERLNVEPIAAVGIEIWTMEDGILFDNILITKDEAEAAKIRETIWRPKFKVEKEREIIEKKGPGPVASFKNSVFELLYQFAQLEFLVSYKEQILDLLEKYAEKNQTISIVGIFGAIATIFALLFNILSLMYSSLYSRIFGKNVTTKVPMSVAKKEDISTPDDPSLDEPTDLSEKVDEPIEGTVDNAECVREFEKEEEPNAARRRHCRET